MTVDRDSRNNTVLEAIIKAHVGSALPIGSKYIGDILGLSSATIRNVMSELEEAGYIKQPHTSAGRIPTDLGYRRYVDHMSSSKKAPRDGIFARVRRYLNEKKAFEEVVEAASRALSEITRYTGIACLSDKKLYFDGTYHMLEQPEFSELSIARDFLRLIEEGEEILRILSCAPGVDGTTIRIGRENEFDGLNGCSIITSTYKVKRCVSGNIGVIGPMRMKYEEVVPVVESLAEVTTEILEEMFQ